jgi:hypothetical protein
VPAVQVPALDSPRHLAASPRAATATMGHRCCSAGPGYRNDGPWMSLAQQRWAIVAVARPAGAASMGHRCGSLSRNVRIAGAVGKLATASATRASSARSRFRRFVGLVSCPSGCGSGLRWDRGPAVEVRSRGASGHTRQDGAVTAFRHLNLVATARTYQTLVLWRLAAVLAGAPALGWP